MTIKYSMSYPFINQKANLHRSEHHRANTFSIHHLFGWYLCCFNYAWVIKRQMNVFWMTSADEIVARWQCDSVYVWFMIVSLEKLMIISHRDGLISSPCASGTHLKSYGNTVTTVFILRIIGCVSLLGSEPLRHESRHITILVL